MSDEEAPAADKIPPPGGKDSLMLPASVFKDWMRVFLERKRAAGGRWPTIYTRRRDSSNLELLLAEGEDGNTMSGFDAVRLGSKQVAKEMSVDGKRGYSGLLCVISFCHDLRAQNKTATQRELYYCHKGGTNSPWRTQTECNECAAASATDARARARASGDARRNRRSVADAATIFDCPRYALGLTTSARGCVAGRLRWRKTGGRAVRVGQKSARARFRLASREIASPRHRI